MSLKDHIEQCEIRDRCSMLVTIIQKQLINHPTYNKHPELKEVIDKISDNADIAYLVASDIAEKGKDI